MHEICDDLKWSQSSQFLNFSLETFKSQDVGPEDVDDWAEAQLDFCYRIMIKLEHKGAKIIFSVVIILTDHRK